MKDGNDTPREPSDNLSSDSPAADEFTMGGLHKEEGYKVSLSDLYRIAKSKTRNLEDAEDRAQDAALKLYTSKGKPEEKSLKAYFSATVRNVISTWFKKESERLEGEAGFTEDYKYNTYDFLQGIEALTISRDAVAGIAEQLPDLQREILWLLLLGMNKTEIARTLGVSRQTVHTAIARIKDLILNIGLPNPDDPDDDGTPNNDGDGNGGGNGGGARAPPVEHRWTLPLLLNNSRGDTNGLKNSPDRPGSLCNKRSDLPVYRWPHQSQKGGDHYMDPIEGRIVREKPRRRTDQQAVLEQLRSLLLELPALRGENREGSRVDSFQHILERIMQDSSKAKGDLCD